MPKIFAYGTLRVDHYNYLRYKNIAEKMNVIEENVSLPGYQLYDLGSYPYVVKTNDPNDVIKVDILDIDETTKNRIDNMERGAGYNLETETVSDIEGTIYVFEKPIRNTKHIENGDYSSYVKK